MLWVMTYLNENVDKIIYDIFEEKGKTVLNY